MLFRQTNIVWMLFVAANGAISFAEEFYPRDRVKYDSDKEKLEGNNVLTDNKNIPISPSLRRRRMNSPKSTINSSSPKMTESQSHDVGSIFYFWAQPFFDISALCVLLLTFISSGVTFLFCSRMNHLFPFCLLSLPCIKESVLPAC